MIDSHAHVAFDKFDDDREEVIKRASAAGLLGWLEVGTDVAQSKKSIELAVRYTGAEPSNLSVWATVGVHPSDIEGLSEVDWQHLELMLQEDVVVAVGEVGLDFYRGGTAERQVPVLERFIDLAILHNKPVVFHVRDPAKLTDDNRGASSASAHDELIKLLAGLPESRRPRGVIHTFSGNYDQAQAYLQLGLHLSFSGVVTYKNAGAIAEVAKAMPLHRMLIETDCPFLSPEPKRSERNEPANVKLVAEKVAELRSLDAAAVIEQTTQNTIILFSLT